MIFLRHLALIAGLLYVVFTCRHRAMGDKVLSKEMMLPQSTMNDNNKRQPDLTMMLDRILAGNEVLLAEMQSLQRQQAEQRADLEQINKRQEIDREQHQQSVIERQHLRLLVANLTRELTAVDNTANMTHGGVDEQRVRQRVKRELQALSCNVTAEIQTVVDIAHATNIRLQRLESRHSELQQQIQLLSEVMAGVERRVINLTATVLQHRQPGGQYPINDLVTRITSELRNSKAEIVSALEQRLRAAAVGNSASSWQPTPSTGVSRRPTTVTHGGRLTGATPNTTMQAGNCVWGISEFNNELYVGRASSTDLEIYDLSSWALKRLLPVTGMGCINELASCLNCDVMYLVDNCNRLIHVIDEHGIRYQWSVDGTPFSLTVTNDMHVLVVFDNLNVVREYSSRGSLIREITLQSDIQSPTHAIKLSENRFIVGQGQPNAEGFHRVCIVDQTGTALQTFGTQKGSGTDRLNTPSRLAIANDTLFVVDTYNDRVVLLNATTLSFMRVLVHEPTASAYFIRTSLSLDENRLYMGHNQFTSGKCQQGRVKVYNLRWVS